MGGRVTCALKWHCYTYDKWEASENWNKLKWITYTLLCIQVWTVCSQLIQTGQNWTGYVQLELIIHPISQSELIVPHMLGTEQPPNTPLTITSVELCKKDTHRQYAYQPKLVFFHCFIFNLIFLLFHYY